MQVDPEKTISATEKQTSLSKYDSKTGSSVSESPLDQFSEEEIKRAWKKVDWHILPVAVLLYLSSYIDRYVLMRRNISQPHDCLPERT